MSELNLTNEMIEAVKAAVIATDKEAEDSMVYCQYLAAILGYSMAGIQIDNDEEFYDHVTNFVKHVRDDVRQRYGIEAPKPQPPAEDAFGVWDPADQS